MLGIQQLSLHRRNLEELSVEPVDTFNECPKTAGCATCRVVGKELAQASITRTRLELCDGVAAGFEQVPKGREIRRAREPA